MKKIKARAVIYKNLHGEWKIITPYVVGFQLPAIFFRNGDGKDESAEAQIKEFRKHWPGEKGELKNVEIEVTIKPPRI